MLRLVHIFDIKSGKSPESFLSWLETTLFPKSKEFGCIERNNWVFLDGIKDPYGKGKKKRKDQNISVKPSGRTKKEQKNLDNGFEVLKD